MVLVWLLAMLVGLAVALGASNRAMRTLTELLKETRIPPFVIGLTLVAVGTDLPEIANSLVASASGHGDINVGDSIGSATTQVTLVLGLLPIFCGRFAIRPRHVLVVGVATALCLGLCTWMTADGRLGHLEAAMLIAAWLLSSWVVWRFAPPRELPGQSIVPGRVSRLQRVAAVSIYLVLVGAGATLAVHGLIEIARLCAAPEYVISFLGLSLGTSLPELFVDITAIRRGHADLAIGDAFGSSLVDSSLSIGIGPLFFTNVVDADLATRGGLVALAGVILATGILAITRRHGRASGGVLILAYAVCYPVLLAR